MARRDFRSPTPHDASSRRKTGRGVGLTFVGGMIVGGLLTFGVTHWWGSPEVAKEARPVEGGDMRKFAYKRDAEQARTGKDERKAGSPKPETAPPPAKPAVIESVSPSPKPPAARPQPPVARPVVAPMAPPMAPISTASSKSSGFLPPVIKPRDVWWLQVAALRKEEDARHLRARVLMLGLDCVIEPPSSATGSLYRVRVGPFKTEALARQKEATLILNNLPPRLITEPIFSP